MNKKNISADEAKKKVAGLWGHIKHLVKDPVRTVPEAKARWKEVLIFAAICFGVTIVPAVISAVLMRVIDDYDNIIFKILNVPTMVGGVGVLFSLFLIFVLIKITLVLKMRECKNCKEQITYGDNVQYKVLREWVKRDIQSKNGVTHVRETNMAEVEMNCTCQNCGTPKLIKMEFRLAHFYDGSLKYSYKLEELVEGFFTGQHIQ